MYMKYLKIRFIWLIYKKKKKMYRSLDLKKDQKANEYLKETIVQ